VKEEETHQFCPSGKRIFNCCKGTYKNPILFGVAAGRFSLKKKFTTLEPELDIKVRFQLENQETRREITSTTSVVLSKMR
jgi:hypothetical protein